MTEEMKPEDLEVSDVPFAGPSRRGVMIHHKPSGLQAVSVRGKSQIENKAIALRMLRAGLADAVPAAEMCTHGKVPACEQCVPSNRVRDEVAMRMFVAFANREGSYEADAREAFAGADAFMDERERRRR